MTAMISHADTLIGCGAFRLEVNAEDGQVISLALSQPLAKSNVDRHVAIGLASPSIALIYVACAVAIPSALEPTRLWGLKVRGLTTPLQLMQKEFSVKELSLDQINDVSGGVLPLLGALAFVYYERNEIADFVGGAMDGFNGTDHMAPN